MFPLGEFDVGGAELVPHPATSALNATAAGSRMNAALGKIEHIVIIVQENRTPDNLFHGLPGADIADNGLDSHGNASPPMTSRIGSMRTTASKAQRNVASAALPATGHGP